MSGKHSKERRLVKRIILAVALLVGLSVTALAVADQLQLHKWKQGISSSDSAVRSHAIYRVARERETRLADIVYEVLKQEQDRQVVEKAGYAAMRFENADGIELLRQRINDGPDDEVRAKLIYYAARLSRPIDMRLLDWMEEGTKSLEPWRRAGSIVGLLELGEPRGGSLLVEAMPAADPEIRVFMLNEFRRIAQAMAETIGQTIDWPDENNLTADDPRWTGLAEFWKQYGTRRLLNDVLTRLEIRDPKWNEIKRLLHARKKVSGWFK